MKCCLNKRKLWQYAGNSVYAVVIVNDDDDLGDDNCYDDEADNDMNTFTLYE